MNAADRVANVLQARLSWPQAEACARDAIDTLRLDPAAVLSLLPAELLADIAYVSGRTTATETFSARESFAAADRLLARLDQVQS